MHKLMIAAACTALLAACSQGPETTPATTASATSTDTATADAKPPVAACPEGASPLPEGLVIDLPLHLAADRITTTANGQMRRVTTYEYLEGSQDDVMAQIRTSMTAAGFTEKADDKERAVPVLIFQKKGAGAVHVAFPVIPEAGPSHPSAKGRIAVNSPYTLDTPAG